MSGRPRVEFDFGGRLSLDLTWTLRYRAVHPTELLASPDDLRRWLSVAGLPVPRAVTRRELACGVELRESIMRAAQAVIDHQPMGVDDRTLINRWAAAPPPSPAIGPDGSRRIAVEDGRELTAAMSAIARDAVDLLTAHDGRLRRCEGPRCSLLFHDSSRPGTRRWCSTTRCGNKVNTTSYRRRQAATAQVVAHH